MGKFVDLTGRRFTRLVVIGRSGSDSTGHPLWQCRCDCGKTVIVSRTNLAYKHSQSCGCLRAEMQSVRRTTHGATRGRRRTPEYRVWIGIKTRCFNRHAMGFADYGGRGITMCAAWKDSYEQFLADVGPRPSRTHSIDREKNNLGYWCGKCAECVRLMRPTNCRWATSFVQGRNKRNNTPITIAGVTRVLSEWAELTGLTTETIMYRIRKGIPPELAIATPARAARLRIKPQPCPPHVWIAPRCATARCVPEHV